MSESDLLTKEWNQLCAELQRIFGQQPTLEAILLLIGMQEVGMRKLELSKEEKQDLMHVGTCTVLSRSQHYEFERRDADGWPHFKIGNPLPFLTHEEQENYLKQHVIRYFDGL